MHESDLLNTIAYHPTPRKTDNNLRKEPHVPANSESHKQPQQAEFTVLLLIT
jgi:hypothetical protein